MENLNSDEVCLQQGLKILLGYSNVKMTLGNVVLVQWPRKVSNCRDYSRKQEVGRLGK